MAPYLSEEGAARGATAELLVMTCIKKTQPNKKPNCGFYEAFLTCNSHAGGGRWEVMVRALLSPTKCFLNQGGKW